ncbi:hypothetical protein K0M31_017791 [Melipona bicolor]|uniref:Uncharacterized protein n=1 Tax=Melipona bicolor TaxID=60889 RepID=A0AA40G5Z1_9HYME|nr:hypothetical protein K0M31_017791 [Melipona bicolor]
MESTSESSTSSLNSECDRNDDPPGYTEETIHEPKEVLRLIIMGQLSIILIQMTIEQSKVTVKSRSMTKFHVLSHKEYEVFHLINRSIDVNALPSNAHQQTEILVPFIKRFSQLLNTDIRSISQTVENIVSSSCEVVLDFDLQKLMQLSKKGDSTIRDIITEMFWRPRTESKLGNKCWFDWVDKGYVIPSYLTSADELDNLSRDYLCDQTIERSSRKLIMWYFLDINSSVGEDTYSLYRKAKKRGSRGKATKVFLVKDITILCDYTTKFHAVHVFRYSCNDSSKYKLDDSSIIDLLKNPLLPTKRPFPFIIKSYDSLTFKYSFYIVYANNIKITNENFYIMLTMLRNILLKMQIERVVIEKSDSLSLRRIFKMLKYIFRNQNITVVIGGEKNC